MGQCLTWELLLKQKFLAEVVDQDMEPQVGGWGGLGRFVQYGIVRQD